jgi:hypothetical protein
MQVNQAISEYCVYTIAHGDKLDRAEKTGQPTSFEERKSWVTGERLWRQARAANKAMPVVLADATDCSCLLFWGLLTKIQIEGDRTRCSVDRVQKFKGKHTPQELVLRRTGKKIASSYIRPYAICRTPDFLEA